MSNLYAEFINSANAANDLLDGIINGSLAHGDGGDSFVDGVMTAPDITIAVTNAKLAYDTYEQADIDLFEAGLRNTPEWGVVYSHMQPKLFTISKNIAFLEAFIKLYKIPVGN